MQLFKMLAEKIGVSIHQSDRKRIGKEVVRFYRIDQEKLCDTPRIEVLNALDRKGEAILQKAQSEEVLGCDTPPRYLNKIGGVVTAIRDDRDSAIELAEMIETPDALTLEEQFQMIYSVVAEAGKNFLYFLKRYLKVIKVIIR